MISKCHFVKGTKYCFCDNFEDIENYDLAIADTKTVWSCHHKLEAFLSMKELIEVGRYFHVSSRELIFVQESGNGDRTHHYYWPHISRKGFSEWNKNNEPWNKGIKTGPLPGETKKKMSESHTNKPHPHKGHIITEETRRKLSEANKGKHNCFGELNGFYGKKHSEESKRKMSEIRKKNPVRYWEGKERSEESKRKMAAAKKGKHWYNNGSISILAFDCPDGYVLGRLKFRHGGQ